MYIYIYIHSSSPACADIIELVPSTSSLRPVPLSVFYVLPSTVMTRFQFLSRETESVIFIFVHWDNGQSLKIKTPICHTNFILHFTLPCVPSRSSALSVCSIILTSSWGHLMIDAWFCAQFVIISASFQIRFGIMLGSLCALYISMCTYIYICMQDSSTEIRPGDKAM